MTRASDNESKLQQEKVRARASVSRRQAVRIGEPPEEATRRLTLYVVATVSMAYGNL